jgi:hypothetical protein
MSDVVYLRPLDPPASPGDIQEMVGHAGACFDLHRVDWVQSFLATGGGRMLCWYQAPDAESVRIALRQLGSDVRAAWAARLVGTSGNGATLPAAANVVAEFRFDPSHAGLDEWQAAAQRAAGGAVTFLGGFVATSGQQAVAIYQAPDADRLRSALEAAGMSPVDVWPCMALSPGG